MIKLNLPRIISAILIFSFIGVSGCTKRAPKVSKPVIENTKSENKEVSILENQKSGDANKAKVIESRKTVEHINWKLYQNEKYGFKFQYPSTMTVEEKESFTLGSWCPYCSTNSSPLYSVTVHSSDDKYEVFVLSKSDIEFSTKLGRFRYYEKPVYQDDEEEGNWLDYHNGKFFNLCYSIGPLGTARTTKIWKGINAYRINANSMSNAYPREGIIITNKHFGLGIGRYCSSEGNCNLETQAEMAASFRLIGDTHAIFPVCKQ